MIYFTGSSDLYNIVMDKITFCYNREVKYIPPKEAPLMRLYSNDFLFIDSDYNSMGASSLMNSKKKNGVGVAIIGSKGYAGAYHLNRDFNLGDLLALPLEVMRPDANVYSEIIGISRHIDEVKATIPMIANADSTVLITGESGTGKEVISNSIHLSSVRKDSNFVVINCGAIPENLFESELFGYKKGAFTGAYTDHAGKIELANNGTLFLDEIGDMPIQMQVKMLRVLQERVVCRVGEAKDRKVNIRVIAATNANLLEKIEKGEFREDLYYRLNVIPLELLPLRKRPEDIKPLIQSFSKDSVYGEAQITEEANKYLMDYAWPGNIRELSNFVERRNVFIHSPKLDLRDVKSILGQTFIGGVDNDSDSGSESIQDEIYQEDFSIEIPTKAHNVNLKDAVTEYERNIINTTLIKHNNSVKDASVELGVKRTTLIEKIKRMGL
jgi:sigma-54 specific flagellar transcriptional regulator A